ncbi:unnamed protein product [Oikopleura dioica]|uniref:Craniofacial development protein 1 n=1 Tax=Oikopleura dioica TaxID=34765 RepID=E4WQ77_OIKDI|nr:unnamed protein product [Oikopleura dioica]
MTKKDSQQADEILRSFKENKPIPRRFLGTQVDKKSYKEPKKDKNDAPVTKTIVEFAGETIAIETKAEALPKKSGPKRKKSRLDEILLKKKKITTIEKTKIDWERHKKENNIDGETEKFSKSKGSLVEKNAFLNRADQRKFEQEREERLQRINNRKIT